MSTIGVMDLLKTLLLIARECIASKEILVRENFKSWFNTLTKEIRIRDRIHVKGFLNKTIVVFIIA